jgi:hypothetical protein
VNKLAKPIYSVEISEDEMTKASKTRESFDLLAKKLDEAFDKLKMVRELLDQFTDPSQFKKMRDLFIRYKHRIVGLFNEFIDQLQAALESMNDSLSDTEMDNIKDTIVGECGELRDGMDTISEILDEPDSPKFLNNFKSTFDRLQERKDSLHEIITDHLFSHIDYDILGRIKLGTIRAKISK